MTAPNKMAKRAAAGTLALAVCLGGGLFGAGAANAALAAAGDITTPATKTYVAPGLTNQAAADLTVALGTAAWSKGDRLLLSAGQPGVSFGTLPTATVEAKTVAGVSYAPTFSVSKVAAEVSGPERIAITFTNSSPTGGGTAPSLELKVTGLKIDVASNTTLGNKGVVVKGQVADNSSGTGFGPLIAYDTNDVVAEVLNVAATVTAASYDDSAATPGVIPDIVIKEATPDAFAAAGIIDVNVTPGAVTSDTGTTAKIAGSTGTATVVAQSATVLRVTTAGTSSTALETLTISGAKYDRSGAGATTLSLEATGATGLTATLAADLELSTKLVTYPAVTRSGGADRYATAEVIADKLLADKVDAVILTNGGAGTESGISIDALSAASLAGALDTDVDSDGAGADTDTDSTPILLTEAGRLPSVTRLALSKSLNAGGTVHILGGTTAVSAAVEDELQNLGYSVNRLAGSDRYDSAAKAAVAAGPVDTFDADGTTVADGVKTAILASGTSPADALAAGQISYNKSHPILLTSQAEVPAATLKAFTDLGIKQVIIVGGEAVISKAVETQLTAAGIKFVRVAGADRFETSAALIKVAETTPTATTGGLALSFTQGTTAHLANGYALADASVAAPLAAASGFGLLFTEKDSLPASTAALLKAGTNLTTVVGIGGTTVLPASTLTAANVAANS